MIRIGHASIDENGTIVGKRAGDQNSKEICIRGWYSKPWNVYLECTDKALANKAAEYMEAICNDKDFGYSQPNRWDGYNSMIRNNKNVSLSKGDFDCSSLILSCYIFAGLNIKPDGYTGNMKNILMATGKFRLYSDSGHLINSKYATRGGVYIKEGSHTAMVLDSNKASEKPVTVASARYRDTNYKGQYAVTTKLYLRAGAGINQTIICTLEEGETVTNYSYYNKTITGDVWLLVTVGGLEGYCSMKFLKKK